MRERPDYRALSGPVQDNLRQIMIIDTMMYILPMPMSPGPTYDGFGGRNFLTQCLAGLF